MATTVARLEAILSARTAEFDAAMTKSEGRMHSVGKVAGIAGLAIAGGLAIGLEKSVKAAMEGEVSQKQLDQALKTTHQSLKAMTPSLEAAAGAARKLGFDDDTTRTALARLEIATGSTKKSIADLSVATDVARFKNTDLEAATKMLTMAMAGSQRATKQLGISIQPVTSNYDALKATMGAHIDATEKAALASAKLIDKQATAAEVIQTVKEKLDGQAEAYSKTAAGGMAQFHAQTQHLEETLGRTLLPAVVAVTTKLATMAEFLAKHKTLTEALIITLGGLAFAMGAVTIAAFVMANALTLGIAAAITALIIGIILMIKHWDQVKEKFNDVTDWLRDHWSQAMIAILGGLPGLLWLAFANNWGDVRGHIRDAFDGIRDYVKDHVIDRIVDFWTELPGRVADAVKGKAGDLWDGVKHIFDKLPGFIKDALGISSPSRVFMEIGEAIVDGAIKGIENKSGALVSAASGAFARIPGKVSGGISGIIDKIPGIGPSSGGDPRSIAQHMMAAFGWSSAGSQWDALNALWTRESGWNPTARNPTSGAFGIPQALPPTKMPLAAQQGDAASQIGWGLQYIQGRYGSPLAAWAHELAVGWYDKGGFLPRGLSLALNTTGRPEPVGGGGTHVTNVYVGDEQMVQVVWDGLRQRAQVFERRNGRSAF